MRSASPSPSRGARCALTLTLAPTPTLAPTLTLAPTPAVRYPNPTLGQVHVPRDFMQDSLPARGAVVTASAPAKITYPMRGCATKDTYGKAQSRA